MPRQIKPENAVQRAVMDLLRAERIWFQRMQSRTFRVTGAGGRRRPMFVGWPGMADILATPEIPSGRRQSIRCIAVLWIECKAPGGKQSLDQQVFQADVEQHGHSYILAYSSDDVLRWLRQRGGNN